MLYPFGRNTISTRYRSVIYHPNVWLSPLLQCQNERMAVLTPANEEYLKFKKYYNINYKTMFEMPLSFGEEVITQTGHGYHFKGGWLPQPIVDRMAGLITSGITVYYELFWERFLGGMGMLKDVPETTEVVATSFKGSVKVVFTIIPAGFTFGLVLFLIEARAGIRIWFVGGLKIVYACLAKKMHTLRQTVSPKFKCFYNGKSIVLNVKSVS